MWQRKKYSFVSKRLPFSLECFMNNIFFTFIFTHILSALLSAECSHDRRMMVGN